MVSNETKKPNKWNSIYLRFFCFVLFFAFRISLELSSVQLKEPKCLHCLRRLQWTDWPSLHHQDIFASLESFPFLFLSFHFKSTHSLFLFFIVSIFLFLYIFPKMFPLSFSLFNFFHSIFSIIFNAFFEGCQ